MCATSFSNSRFRFLSSSTSFSVSVALTPTTRSTVIPVVFSFFCRAIFSFSVLQNPENLHFKAYLLTCFPKEKIFCLKESTFAFYLLTEPHPLFRLIRLLYRQKSLTKIATQSPKTLWTLSQYHARHKPLVGLTCVPGEIQTRFAKNKSHFEAVSNHSLVTATITTTSFISKILPLLHWSKHNICRGYGHRVVFWKGFQLIILELSLLQVTLQVSSPSNLIKY